MMHFNFDVLPTELDSDTVGKCNFSGKCSRGIFLCERERNQLLSGTQIDLIFGVFFYLLQPIKNKC